MLQQQNKVVYANMTTSTWYKYKKQTSASIKNIKET